MVRIYTCSVSNACVALPPGVGPEFTEAQLRKQHRLLSLRYHPDAAARNGVEPAEAAEP